MKVLLCLALLLPGVAVAEWSARPLSEIAVYPEFRAPATVVSLDESRIAAEVSGRIEALPVRVGQAVARGAELVRLDAAALRIEAGRAAAQADLIASRIGLAEAQLEQSKALAARGFISADGLRIKETELAVLRSEHVAARQALAAAALQLSRTVIRAPYAGVVRERLASVGELAAPGTALLVLAASADVEVRAQVPAAQVDSLRAAGRWRFVAGSSSQPLRLVRVSPLVSAAGQTREVVFAPESPLAPGRAGELRWHSVTAHLPAGYLQQRDGVAGAYVERDGRPDFVALPDAQVGRPTPVDWPPDTRVIDEGRFAIGLGDAAAAGSGR